MSDSPFPSGSDEPIYVDPVDDPETSESLRRVLLVTDRVRERHVLMSALEALPVATAFASSRHDCLRLAETLSPDLVVVDVELRGQEGWSICDDLSGRRVASQGEEDPSAWSPEIVAVHGGRDGVAERARDLGLQHQLQWPFAVDEARSALEERIASRTVAGETRGSDSPVDGDEWEEEGGPAEWTMPDDLDLADWALDLADDAVGLEPGPPQGPPSAAGDDEAAAAEPEDIPDAADPVDPADPSVFSDLSDDPLGGLAPLPDGSSLPEVEAGSGVGGGSGDPSSPDSGPEAAVPGGGVLVEEEDGDEVYAGLARGDASGDEAPASPPEVVREALPPILSELFSANGVHQVLILDRAGGVVFTSSRTPRFALARFASHSLELLEQAHGLLRESSERTGDGDGETPEAVVVEGRRGCVLLRSIGTGYRLVVCVDRKSGLGQVSFLIRRIEGRLAQALATDRGE